MAIEKHMLQTHSLFEKAGEVFEGVAKLKERIAELEHDRDWWKNEAKRQETLATQNWDYHKRMEKEWLRCNNAYARSMWLARALRARDKAFEYHFKNNVEMCAKWDNVHLILMAKAEEYK